MINGVNVGGQAHNEANCVVDFVEGDRYWITDNAYTKKMSQPSPRHQNSILVFRDGIGSDYRVKDRMVGYENGDQTPKASKVVRSATTRNLAVLRTELHDELEPIRKGPFRMGSSNSPGQVRTCGMNRFLPFWLTIILPASRRPPTFAPSIAPRCRGVVGRPRRCCPYGASAIVAASRLRKRSSNSPASSDVNRPWAHFTDTQSRPA